MQVFDRDCLIKLGSAIAPAGPSGSAKDGDQCVKVELEFDGKTVVDEVPYGSMKLVPLEDGKKAKAVIHPSRQFDVGKGFGHALETTVSGGVVGLTIDCRGRVFDVPEDKVLRNKKLVEWFRAMNLYPEESLMKYAKV